jgi:hypothetical protein
MLKKSKLLFIFFLPVFLSCTTLDMSRKVIPPTKSYVKIFHTLRILQCTDTLKSKCPIGEYQSMGSGMVVDIIEDQTTVITAGHVCESDVDVDKISLHSQSVSVIDYRGREHDAYTIKTTGDNGKGSVDMCALWVPTLKQAGVKFSMFPPKTGQELYYVGSPAGIYHPPVAPILTGIYSGQIDASNSMISIPATGGSSGSVVMDMNNRMVGVLWAAHSFHHVSIMTNWRASALFLYDVTKMYRGRSELNLPPLKN